MDFFGMGIGEILVIMMLALILFGPGKLPEIAAGIGRAVREFRNATRELTSEFEQAFREVQTSTAEVTTSVLSVQQETRAALSEVATTTQQAAQAITADQAPAPVTTPAEASVPPPSPVLSTATHVTVANGRREPTKEDPLADLVDLDDLLNDTSSFKATESHWEH
ncbi:twin-arginine translocase TatA/TatE family subunit [Thermomicrobium sp. CFH 73360]|uniref:Sec-independent protein translocase subunit TatA/TatB n=1 Tax=Thermomicrobium sp. CFH 73360 TaxID=2951987 RepID=UPI0020773F78|nr:twin-arginine translocase TatA/TatE family subunit [Thermomicrobium sp. CFH 73360]MCM8746702.1 twin-arginine translocase TatA/TatE family subunit [Thermomicrobium sp. CFH 73360]